MTMPPDPGLRIVNLHAAIEGIRNGMGIPVVGAPATGVGLLTNGHLGADLLRVAPGDQFPVHTHPGDHLLLCLEGRGTITVGQITYEVRPGDFYMVDGLVPHAVGGAADCEHVLMAIGAPHKTVDAPDRMAFVDWTGLPVNKPLFVA